MTDLEVRVVRLEEALRDALRRLGEAYELASRALDQAGASISYGGGGAALQFRWAKLTEELGAGSNNPATDPITFGTAEALFYNEAGDLTDKTGEVRNLGNVIATGRVVGVVGVEGGPWDVTVDLCDPAE